MLRNEDTNFAKSALNYLRYLLFHHLNYANLYNYYVTLLFRRMSYFIVFFAGFPADKLKQATENLRQSKDEL